MRLLRADILLASVMFQILMIEKIRFILCALLQFYTSNSLELSRTAACYFSFAHVAGSEQDIQNTRQPSQTYSIYNKN
ncbi:MAG: hypothetical protein D8B38_05875 [Candidatus Saccharimonas sp.]|jgi:hypothetical protein|nr:MAG: hypothetical protein D8B38_05875 [Candidatus Saccharimonas sp.]